MSEKNFHVVTIPLNREGIIEFLMPPSAEPRGAIIDIVDLRPGLKLEEQWSERLRQKPGLDVLLERDHPKHLITQTHSDRLVPAEFLTNDPEYLSRNLGGWSPVFFGVMHAGDKDWEKDPVLRHAVKQDTYGSDIRYFGINPEQVKSRLSHECGVASGEELAQSVLRLHDWRRKQHFNKDASSMIRCADALYNNLASGGELTKSENGQPAIPRPVLIDELMGQMVRIEAFRRKCVADHHTDQAAVIKKWQQQKKDETGLMLILKGEYIMGRHRCSTVLIAPQLEIVAKQPGPEPFHEARLGAVEHNGKPENWPELTRDGALVTSAGRIRIIIEEGLIERLNHLFYHDVKLISAFGFIIEPYVTGPTLQEYVLEKPGRLTPEVYDFIMLHQQVCERMGVENGDWHAANFMVMPKMSNPIASGIPSMTHIDWGAARSLEDHERTEELKKARVNQVQNIAYSFHDQQLARIARDLHEDLVADDQRMQRIWEKADKLVRNASS